MTSSERKVIGVNVRKIRLLSYPHIFLAYAATHPKTLAEMFEWCQTMFDNTDTTKYKKRKWRHGSVSILIDDNSGREDMNVDGFFFRTMESAVLFRSTWDDVLYIDARPIIKNKRLTNINNMRIL